MDNGALGLTDRGIDTEVRPELNGTLAESPCISCGQCVATCPVGALQERIPLDKEIPVELFDTQSVCAYCSVGCSPDLQNNGDELYRSIPHPGSAVDNGYLCVRGRFGFRQVADDKRILHPMVRKDGELVEVSWEEALRTVARTLQARSINYGGNTVALSLSDRLTNEAIYLGKKFANEVLGTKLVTSFNRELNGIADVIGYDASTVTFDEMENAKNILLVGSDIYHDHTIAAIKLKKAVDKGAKLTIVNDEQTHADAWASQVIRTDNNQFLREVLKAVLEQSTTDADGTREALDALKEVTVQDASMAFAKDYMESKAAVIVYDDKRTSVATRQLLADIAVAAGQIGKGRRGLLALKDKNNSQGIVDLGVNTCSGWLKDKIENGDMKALFIVGEDVKDLNTDKLNFLVVADLALTETAKKADVVLPLALAAEQDGSYTNTERRVQPLFAALDPKNGLMDWEIFDALASAIGMETEFGTSEDVLFAMMEEGLIHEDLAGESHWSFSRDRVYLSDGYATESGKPTLVVSEDTALKVPYVTTDFVEYEMKEQPEEFRHKEPSELKL